MMKSIANKKLIQTIQRLVQYLGFAFIFWSFGLLILVPLSDSLPQLKSFVGIIIIIPIGFLFFISINNMKLLSRIIGKALYDKYKKTENSKPYIHLLYIYWIIIGIIFFSPPIFIINTVFGGIFLFGALLSLVFIAFLNLKYIIAGILQFLYYSKN